MDTKTRLWAAALACSLVLLLAGGAGAQAVADDVPQQPEVSYGDADLWSEQGGAVQVAEYGDMELYKSVGDKEVWDDSGEPIQTAEYGDMELYKSVGDEEIWDAQGNPIEGEDSEEGPVIADPYEGWNRFWYHFNDIVYTGVLDPLARGYAFIIPEKPRSWVSNFFENLLFPVRFVNCILQGKLNNAGIEASKFIGNTFFGLGGLGAPMNGVAPTHPTPYNGDEDFGQTLGVWGMGNGVYLTWPFIGPSTFRDTIGYAGDYFLTPTSYLNPWYWSIAAKSYDKVNEVSLNLGEYESLKEASIDPYEAIKDAYVRFRAKQVKQ